MAWEGSFYLIFLALDKGHTISYNWLFISTFKEYGPGGHHGLYGVCKWTSQMMRVSKRRSMMREGMVMFLQSCSAQCVPFLLCCYSTASHKVNRNQNPPEGLLKHRLLDPTPEFNLFGLECSLIIYCPNKFSSGITGPETIIWKPLLLTKGKNSVLARLP